MPAYKKSKYTTVQTQEIKMRAFEVLSNSEQALTIDEIQKADLCLVGSTSQKIARVLNDLSDFGFIEKVKSKNGRMMYMSLETAERYRNIAAPRSNKC